MEIKQARKNAVISDNQKSPDAIRQQRRRDKIKASRMKWVRLLVHESWEPYLKAKVEPACQHKKGKGVIK